MTDLTRHSQSLGAKPALIIVDMITGFTDPASPLGGDYPSVIAANKKLLSLFRKAGLPIFFTVVTYSSNEQAKVFRNRLPALDILSNNSKWVNIDPRLARRNDETIIEKQFASAFFKTNLAALLTTLAIDSLVVTGLTTSGCVRATAVDGLQHDYKVFVPREAVGDRNLGAHTANLFDMHAKYADVVDVNKIVTAVKGMTK